MKPLTIFLSLIILSLFNGGSLSAQWEWQNPRPQGNTLNDVFFIDQTTGWAVGDAGTIMKSVDGGLTYDLINFPTHKNFASVEFFDMNTGLVAGDSGLILKTFDGGLSWNQVETGITGNITDLTIISSSIGWLASDDGQIIKSMDYGDSWQVSYSNDSMQFKSLSFVDENHGWAAGGFDIYSARMVRTSDGGETWTILELPFNFSILDICFIDTLIGYASITTIDEPQLLAKTTNGGESWQFIGEELYYDEFYDIMFTDQDHGWIAGTNNTIPTSFGVLYYTDDGGMTWLPCETLGYSNRNDFNAVYFIDENIGWMVGTAGNTLYSTDGGVQWTNINTGFNGHCSLEDVFFIDDQNGWIVGAAFYTFESRIFHTSDGGNSWTTQSPLDNMLNSVFFINPLEGWITGGRSLQSHTAAIFHTTNSGAQWETQFSENINNGDFTDVYFKDTEHGWAVGDGGNQYPPENISLFYYTQDGGENWNDHSYLIHHALSSVCFADDETGFIAGHKTILQTVDGGDTWTEIWSGPHYLKDIFFTDSNHGWAIGDSATRYPYRDVIMRTTDGGITWEEQFPGFGSLEKQLFFTDNEHGWIARDEGDILYTIDGGVTWQHMLLNFNEEFGGIFFTDMDHGWVVGSGEAIFNITNGSIVGVEEEQDVIQSSSASWRIRVQSYPNPTSGIVDCRWSIVDGRWVSLKIYDLQGREVMSVMDKKMPTGEHSMQFDASGLPDGIYLIRIQSDTEVATGKFIVAK